MLTSVETKISFFIMILVSLIYFFEQTNLYKGNYIFSVIPAYQAYMNFFFPQAMLLLILPLITILPFADSFYTDKKIGVINYILTRTTPGRYYIYIVFLKKFLLPKEVKMPEIQEKSYIYAAPDTPLCKFKYEEEVSYQANFISENRSYKYTEIADWDIIAQSKENLALYNDIKKQVYEKWGSQLY